jgi:hypothetical protein
LLTVVLLFVIHGILVIHLLRHQHLLLLIGNQLPDLVIVKIDHFIVIFSLTFTFILLVFLIFMLCMIISLIM